MQLGHFRFHVFEKSDRADLFQEHLNIKYKVFVKELGWNSIAHSVDDEKVVEDLFDKEGIFVLAENEEGEIIGTVRGLCAKHMLSLPHGQLFEKHAQALSRCGVSSPWVTINSLAVLPKFRGTRISGSKSIAGTALSEAILIVLLDRLRRKGCGMVFVAVLPDGSAKLCIRLGFRVIDAPYAYGANQIRAINMAMVINRGYPWHARMLPEYLKLYRPVLDSQEQAAADYFSRVESQFQNAQWLRRLLNIRRSFRLQVA